MLANPILLQPSVYPSLNQTPFFSDSLRTQNLLYHWKRGEKRVLEVLLFLSENQKK